MSCSQFFLADKRGASVIYPSVVNFSSGNIAPFYPRGTVASMVVTAKACKT